MFPLLEKLFFLVFILGFCSDVGYSASKRKITPIPIYLVDEWMKLPCQMKPETKNNMTISVNDEEIELYSDPRNESVLLMNPITGLYKCKIKDNGLTIAERHFNVTSTKYEDVAPKVIDQKYILENETIKIQCTIEIDIFLRIFKTMDWITPLQDSDRIIIENSREPHPVLMNYWIYKSTLNIVKATKKDSGRYSCAMRLDTYVGYFKHVNKRTSVYLEVHDANFSKLEIISRKMPEQVFVGDDAEFEVVFDAYPYPVIKWIGPSGMEITNPLPTGDNKVKNKFQIETTLEYTKLRIRKLKMTDNGVYKVELKIPGSRTKALQGSLVVWENRLIRDLRADKEYYMENETATFECLLASTPRLSIFWTFKSSNSHYRLLTSEEDYLLPHNLILKLKVESSGAIQCNVYDDLACYSVERKIIMTDVPGGRGIIPLTKNVAVGDSVELICAATMYNFRDTVEWLTEDYAQVISTDRMKVTKTNTSLSYRTVLTFDSVEKSDQKRYLCKTKRKDTFQESRQFYFLHVHDPEGPNITETNMNGPELKFDIGVSSLKPIILSCYVTGLPEPVITWSKDDVKIEPGIPSKFGRCEFGFRNESQELHIEYLYKECSGEYRCRAENRVDFTEAYQEITIEGTESLQTLITLNVILVIACLFLIIYCWLGNLRVRRKLVEATLVQIERGLLDSPNPDITLDKQAELLADEKISELLRERKIKNT